MNARTSLFEALYEYSKCQQDYDFNCRSLKSDRFKKMEHYSSFKEEQELISSVDSEKSYGAFFKHVPAQSSHRPRFVIFEDVTGDDNVYMVMIHIAFVRNGKSVITQKLVNGPDSPEEFVKLMH